VRVEILPVALAIYATASAITFIAFGVDKRRAGRGDRRIPERTLHALELLGGWPGALLGMQVFRHKRRKAAYFVVTWALAVGHAIAFAAWLWRA